MEKEEKQLCFAGTNSGASADVRAGEKKTLVGRWRLGVEEVIADGAARQLSCRLQIL